MKNHILSLALMLLFTFSTWSCAHDDLSISEVSPERHLELMPFTEQIKTMGQASFQLGQVAFTSNEVFIRNDSGSFFNKRKFAEELIIGMNNRYYQFHAERLQNLIKNFQVTQIGKYAPQKITSGRIEVSSFGYFSHSQVELMQPFVDKILEEKNLESIHLNAVNYLRDVENSDLTFEEKLELITLGANVLSFIEFVQEGGIEDIERMIRSTEDSIHQSSSSTNRKVLDCSVSARNVLAGAVVGFGIGAAQGCITGGTGGTVVFPVVGTVTGCVGVGMVGGAVGFVSGVFAGIATELLLTCGR